MSITKNFETRLLPLHNSTVYGKDETETLLEHARSLEAMLKKHEWNGYDQDGGDNTCIECGQHGHTPACSLAKLLEGVE